MFDSQLMFRAYISTILKIGIVASLLITNSYSTKTPIRTMEVLFPHDPVHVHEIILIRAWHLVKEGTNGADRLIFKV